MVETKEHIFTFLGFLSTWRQQSNRQYCSCAERQMQTANISLNGRRQQRHIQNTDQWKKNQTQYQAMHHIVIRTMQSYELLINVCTVKKTKNHTINLGVRTKKQTKHIFR